MSPNGPITVREVILRYLGALVLVGLNFATAWFFVLVTKQSFPTFLTNRSQAVFTLLGACLLLVARVGKSVVGPSYHSEIARITFQK